MTDRNQSSYVIARKASSGIVPYGKLLSEELFSEAEAMREPNKIQKHHGDAAVFLRTSPHEQWMLFSAIAD